MSKGSSVVATSGKPGTRVGSDGVCVAWADGRASSGIEGGGGTGGSAELMVVGGVCFAYAQELRLIVTIAHSSVDTAPNLGVALLLVQLFAVD